MSNQLLILERIFHRECRSLAQYLAESWLWTHGDDREAEDLVRSVLADERRWAERLAELIYERGGLPRPGSYPTDFTNSNLHFLSLDSMLRRLADAVAGSVAALQRELSFLAGDTTLRPLVEQMIERKGGQVTALEKLAASLSDVKHRAY
jgi:hypothetical protein